MDQPTAEPYFSMLLRNPQYFDLVDGIRLYDDQHAHVGWKNHTQFHNQAVLPLTIRALHRSDEKHLEKMQVGLAQTLRNLNIKYKHQEPYPKNGLRSVLWNKIKHSFTDQRPAQTIGEPLFELIEKHEFSKRLAKHTQKLLSAGKNLPSRYTKRNEPLHYQATRLRDTTKQLADGYEQLALDTGFLEKPLDYQKNILLFKRQL